MQITTKLKCDCPECSWELEEDFGNVPNWHNKKCPICNQCIIVDDGDMTVWNGIKLIIALDGAIDPEKKQPRCSVAINTAGLRDK